VGQKFVNSEPQQFLAPLTNISQAVCIIISRHTSSERTPPIKTVRIARDATRIFLLDHPFISRHIDMLQTNNSWYLIVEYVDGGNLSQYLADHGRLKEKQAREFSRQILSALDYLHRHDIVHCSLKPRNIELTTQGNLKLTGFMLNNIFSPRGHLEEPTRGYQYYSAPELLKDMTYVGPEIDVWGFGVTLYELVCGKVPFQAENVQTLFAIIINAEVNYKSDMTQCKFPTG